MENNKRIIWSLAIVILIISGYYLLVTDKQIEKENMIKQKEKTSIKFKELSSDKIIEKINGLNENDQITVYREHSAIIKELQQFWQKNKDVKDAQLTLNKILPVLISEGWTEESVRDALSWMTTKAIIILDRDPSWWCEGDDCAPKPDDEIKIILKDDKSLTKEIIDGIFRELEIDNNI